MKPYLISHLLLDRYSSNGAQSDFLNLALKVLDPRTPLRELRVCEDPGILGGCRVLCPSEMLAGGRQCAPAQKHAVAGSIENVTSTAHEPARSASLASVGNEHRAPAMIARGPEPESNRG